MRRVLVIAFDHQIRVNLRNFFEERRWKVLSTTSVKAAILSLITQAGFALILVTNTMPDLNRLLEYRDSKEDLRTIPLICLDDPENSSELEVLLKKNNLSDMNET